MVSRLSVKVKRVLENFSKVAGGKPGRSQLVASLSFATIEVNPSLL